MDALAAPRRIITDESLVDYFQSTVADAVTNQQVDARGETVRYVVNLLIDYTRTDRLFERTPDGVGMRPLAELYADALESLSAEERHLALRRMGDVALFISGLFADSLNRKVVDVDYYISMGGTAYGCLADSVPGRGAEVFGELSRKFTEFVDVLGEVGDGTSLGSDGDVMRIYELWLRTGSRRAARRLRKAGIEPIDTPATRNRH